MKKRVYKAMISTILLVAAFSSFCTVTAFAAAGEAQPMFSKEQFFDNIKERWRIALMISLVVCALVCLSAVKKRQSRNKNKRTGYIDYIGVGLMSITTEEDKHIDTRTVCIDADVYHRRRRRNR